MLDGSYLSFDIMTPVNKVLLHLQVMNMVKKMCCMVVGTELGTVEGMVVVSEVGNMVVGHKEMGHHKDRMGHKDHKDHMDHMEEMDHMEDMAHKEDEDILLVLDNTLVVYYMELEDNILEEVRSQVRNILEDNTLVDMVRMVRMAHMARILEDNPVGYILVERMARMVRMAHMARMVHMGRMHLEQRNLKDHMVEANTVAAISVMGHNRQVHRVVPVGHMVDMEARYSHL